MEPGTYIITQGVNMEEFYNSLIYDVNQLDRKKHYSVIFNFTYGPNSDIQTATILAQDNNSGLLRLETVYILDIDHLSHYQCTQYYFTWQEVTTLLKRFDRMGLKFHELPTTDTKGLL